MSGITLTFSRTFGGAHVVAEPEHNTHPPEADDTPDTEHRPLGALAVVGFLTVTILVFWYGMFFLNMVRN
jgi:hypothetical protein